MPSVVFFLIAAWAAGKGWPTLELKLLAHPVYGVYIREWRARGAVPRRAKWLATAMMTFSLTVLHFAGTTLWLKAAIAALLLSVGTWLWLRPEP